MVFGNSGTMIGESLLSARAESPVTVHGQLEILRLAPDPPSYSLARLGISVKQVDVAFTGRDFPLFAAMAALCHHVVDRCPCNWWR